MKIISDKAQIQAVNDANAAKLYAKLEQVHSQVFAERGPKRVAAVRIAAELVDLGYSLRGAAKAAGKKADNKLQRYFEVGRAMLAETMQTEGAVPAPDGFTSWTDAIAALPLDGMAQHIRDYKAGIRETTAILDPDAAIRAAVNSALAKLAGLVSGKATGKAAGYTVGKAQLTHYLKAFIAAGLVVDGAKLDKLTLTAQPIPADAAGIAAKLAESLQTADETSAPAPLVVNA